ncbi:uncharacterized protein LOC134751218 [Cydia strobilella]|uniref:uncharacterized protein LOC134751218 n=1 Tax=Cydia strobilella TaxID=1100964 RepID=UPI0030062843
MDPCCCCLQCPPDKDLTTPFTHNGKTDTYYDLFKECFNLHLVVGGAGACDICSACVGRLRDASDFKLQVQRSQAELQARLDKAESAVKFEPADDSADDDSLLLYDEPIEKLEMLDEDETGEVLGGNTLIKSEMCDDATSDSTTGEFTSHTTSVESDVGINDVIVGWQSGQMCSDGISAGAREQLAMACSVVLVRLRDEATVHSGDEPYTCEHCGAVRKHPCYYIK